MADSVKVLRRATELKIREIESAAGELADGRGSQLKPLLLHTVERFDKQLQEIDAELASIDSAQLLDDIRAQLRINVAQKFERLGQQVDVSYVVLNTYGDSVGRTDVPIGLQYLLGVVLDELVERPADPIVHRSAIRMYSTKDLVELIDEFLTPFMSPRLVDTFQGEHPIIFNLPALDPSNALLSPIIAHEVAHTAVEESLRGELRSRVDADVRALLESHLKAENLPLTGSSADEWAATFRDWCGELICDAVALVAAGPAFALAFASFAPPNAAAFISSHPPVRDRIALHLQILDELGWTSLMEEWLPTVNVWLTGVSSQPMLQGSAEEKFLREAMKRVTPDITAIARDHVASPLLPADTDLVLRDLVVSLADGVPMVETGESAASPWQIILAGWIAAIDKDAHAGEELLQVVANRGLSDLLIKSLELSSIVRNWRHFERPRP